MDDGHDLAAGNGLIERLDVDAEILARNADDEEAVERRPLDDGCLLRQRLVEQAGRLRG